MERLATTVCIDCICKPVCKNKSAFGLVDDCQILRNALWDMVFPKERPIIITKEQQIHMDLVNIDDIGQQIIVESRHNKNGASEVYANIKKYSNATVKLRLSKIISSERIVR